MEEWREIPDFPGYEISNMGNVRSWKYSGGLRSKPHKLKPLTKYGRKLISLYKDGKNVKKRLVQLMVAAWMPEQINRRTYPINGNALDCSLANIGISDDRLHELVARSRKVAKVDKDGNIVKIYQSIAEAADDNFMSKPSMSNRLHGRFQKRPIYKDDYTYRFYLEEAE